MSLFFQGVIATLAIEFVACIVGIIVIGIGQSKK